MRLSVVLGVLLGIESAVAIVTPRDVSSNILLDRKNKWNKNTIISFPNTPEFTNATDRWSSYSEPTFIAGITPATEEDVAKAVKLATKNKIGFLAQGGRHGIAYSFRSLKNGWSIDLSLLKSVTVDKKAATVTVGAGVRFGEVYDPLDKAGFMIQTGSGSCPGMLGAGLGAGVGRYQGMFGLVIDALVSARIVTAKGEVVEVSAKKNSDLFWAIRGAGANFGIVTSATFKVQKVPNNNKILNVDFIIPASANGSYFDILHTLENMPPELATIQFVMWNATLKQPQILANWVYTGPEEKGLELMAPVFALNPVRSEKKVVPWKSLVGTAGFGADQGWCQSSPIPWTQLSANTKRLDADTMRTMFAKTTAFYESVQDPGALGTTVELEIFNSDAMRAVPADATAYPWRDSIAYMMFELTWSNGEGEAAAIALAEDLRRDFVATSGYDDLAVYVNYASGNETLEQIYGANKLKRLAETKKKWDPKQVFGFSNPLPTKYP
ncbi:FAD-binding domain-containing protein [Colletotrichum karsti]|uniref:FAD-binding domain-containing protein n=1 Tax=Colletotrichum karsti TaxID=1095194 RepID=A0A9P6IDN4_9PEZI|nr:FAD-binding domain-containing protein [Colletotrichum karsti]KAF9878631.1 FAD-binding domain-containing protein [Colletotrichum karsti]